MGMAKSKELKKLEKWLGVELPRDLQTEFKKIVKDYTVKTVETAKENAPVDTGYLEGSINYKILDSGFTGVVYVGAEYGIYVEFGSAKWNTMAQPFLYPAFMYWGKIYLDTMEQILDKKLDE